MTCINKKLTNLNFKQLIVGILLGSDNIVYYYRHIYDFVYRIDNPALIYDDGSKCWMINNKYHRIDGPAVIFDNSYKEWWVNGNRSL